MQTKKKQVNPKNLEKKAQQIKPVPKIPGPTRYQANSVVSCRVEGDEGAILFNADNDCTTLINATGLFCWTCLEHPATLEELVTLCMKNYTGIPDPAAVRQDIKTFIDKLVPEYISEVGSGGD